MKVLKNYLYNAFYQLLVIILPLVTIPYVSRVLGPTGVGINSYTNSIIQYFILFGSLGTAMYGNQQIAYIRDNPKQTSKVFWEVELMSVVSVTISYGAFLIFLLLTNQYHVFYLEQSLMLIGTAFDISWFFMGQEDFKATVTKNTIVKIASLVATFVFVRTANDVGIYILILALSQLVGNLSLWPYVFRYVSFQRPGNLNVMRHFIPSLRLFIPQVAIQIYLVVNKTMLGVIDGPEYSGFFDYGDKIVRIVLSLVTASGTVMLPHVAHAFSNGENEKVRNYLYKSVDLISLIAFPLTLGMAAVANEFANWFFDPQFAIVGNLIASESIIIVLIAWGVAVGQQFLIPTNQIRPYTVAVILGAVVNIVFNIPMIMLWGVYGAVIATIMSEAIVTGYQLWIVRKTVPDLRRAFKNVPVYLFASVVMFGVIKLIEAHVAFSAGMMFIEVLVGGVLYVLAIIIFRPQVIKDIKQILLGR